MDIKEFKASFLPTSFYQATLPQFIMALSWFEVIASYMANLKVKFKSSSCGNEFNKRWANLVIYNNNFLNFFRVFS